MKNVNNELWYFRYILFEKNNTKIISSYDLTNDEMKKVINFIVQYRIEKKMLVTRTKKSYLRELKAHNRLYKLHLFESHTKDCDLEEDIKTWKKVFYGLMGI